MESPPPNPTTLRSIAGAQDRLLRGFLGGDSRSVTKIRGIVEGVLRFRGYYIPARDRDDVVQETMAQLWREAVRPGFMPQQEFPAFVRCVAHRRCVDWVRRRKKEADPPAGDEPRARRPDEILFDAERIELGEKVLRSLREKCRRIIALYVGRRMKYQEIAAMEGSKEPAVRKRMSLCLKEARQLLQALQRS